jgi:hypothetical protein
VVEVIEIKYDTIKNYVKRIQQIDKVNDDDKKILINNFIKKIVYNQDSISI